MGNSTSKVLEFIKKYKTVTVQQVIDYTGLSRQIVSKYLKDLLNNNFVEKQGNPPVVFYSLKKESFNIIDLKLAPDEISFIEDNYFNITPLGNMLSGVEGFAYWCNKQGLEVNKTAKEYITTLKKYHQYKNKKTGLIDSLSKMKDTFEKTYLDEMYLLDFYSIERFGKTKLGSLLFYGKQAEDIKLINKVYDVIKYPIYSLINNKKIDAVCFIPPTANRKVQFQTEIEKLLKLPVEKLELVKVVNQIRVQQKSLSKLVDRVENARGTIFIKPGFKGKLKNILIIDDAVGSGATLNEVASKIKESGICSGKIIGLAIVGSFKGFEVLKEV